jgi:hypothetical protein
VLAPYRGCQELLEACSSLASRGAAVEEIGRTERGRPLLAVRVSPRPPESGEASTAVLSGIHPLEWIGVEAHLALLERLLAEPPGREVLCIPLVNPDGIARVEEHRRAGRRRFVRHNARGVDLNRNFPTAWGERALVARLVPWVYRAGTGPASEPEIRSVVTRLAGCRIDRALSLHSFGGAVLFPFAHRLRSSPRAAEHRAWARALARRAGGYRPVQCSRWVPGATAGGLELDWFHEAHGALSLLVECARGRLRFARARDLFDPFHWFNPVDPAPVAARVADAVLPFVRGEDLPK